MDQYERSGLAEARQRYPWEQVYPPGLDWQQSVPEGTVPGLLDEAAARWGDKPAIEYRGRTIGFGKLADLVNHLAAGLIAAGFGPGSTIALFLPNTPWHSVCFFAGLKAGARIVHLSPLDAQRELLFKLSDSGADIVITTDLGGLAAGAAKLAESGAVSRVLVGEDAHWGGAAAQFTAYGKFVGKLDGVFAEVLPANWPKLHSEDLAVLQYTGGTTGMPKAAMLTHRNLLAATFSYLAWRDETTPPSGKQRVIGVLPMFHVYAMTVVLLLNIVDGNEILLRPRFDAAEVLRDITEYRATAFPAVPTMFIALLAEPGAETADYSSLSGAGSGGAPLPSEVAQHMERLLGHDLRTGWGMTETSAIGTRTPPGTRAGGGVIGAPLPNVEMRVVALDDPLRALPPGQIGEIAVRGPNVFSGYWKQPELTAKSFAGGFFLTGDIGFMDERGIFSLVDRKKRMIISGGFNVYPAMVENCIYEHPAVEEVIVIGVPDAYRGEATKAFIKQRAGTERLTLDALREFLKDRVGKHEMPAALEIRESLPKSPVGKLLATQLAEEERARAANAA